MALFNILFPREAAQLRLSTRRIQLLMQQLGIDESSDPLLADVVDELRAGREIKAVQLYCQTQGVGLGEGQIAVSELKQRLNL